MARIELPEDLKDIKWVLEKIIDCAKAGFTGNLQINYFKGGVSNINKTESIKKLNEDKNSGGM